MPVAESYRSDLLDRLRTATADLAWAVRALPPEDSHFRPQPTDWTIHEHVSHMRDMEQEVYLPLLRWATVPDMLDPLDYSRKEWLERRYRPDEPLHEITNDILRIRDEQLSIFQQMSDETWARWREDTRWGPLTCQWIAELAYRHSLDHLQNIVAILQDLHLEKHRPRQPSGGRLFGAR